MWAIVNGARAEFLQGDCDALISGWRRRTVGAFGGPCESRQFRPRVPPPMGGASSHDSERVPAAKAAQWRPFLRRVYLGSPMARLIGLIGLTTSLPSFPWGRGGWRFRSIRRGDLRMVSTIPVEG